MRSVSRSLYDYVEYRREVWLFFCREWSQRSTQVLIEGIETLTVEWPKWISTGSTTKVNNAIRFENIASMSVLRAVAVDGRSNTVEIWFVETRTICCQGEYSCSQAREQHVCYSRISRQRVLDLATASCSFSSIAAERVRLDWLVTVQNRAYLHPSSGTVGCAVVSFVVLSTTYERLFIGSTVSTYIHICIYIQTSIRSHYHLITCIHWRNSLRLLTTHTHFIFRWSLIENVCCLAPFFSLSSMYDYSLMVMMIIIEKKPRKIFAGLLKILT